ncbi:hypothetical protein N7513_003207 [Penicillium frequentans]|uniref:Uncharacterized protein n=1 Tax=Penicillium frequentans TaxID=3151616 RepID=A0AAD6G8E8_9EURO|nr:hypothetical protein N7494_013279 [Penicillium glabrum]KAJ5522888.1 hypothetical protein N7494_013318 [Penicillium glabrum]KAJ5522946.1 hypothetical protein N7494_013260 [Penicillium glabrum]KAJ5557621.1 hypothetical protein N7513_003207 [Penicillium glabrum]
MSQRRQDATDIAATTSYPVIVHGTPTKPSATESHSNKEQGRSGTKEPKVLPHPEASAMKAETIRLCGGEPDDSLELCDPMLEYFATLDFIDS